MKISWATFTNVGGLFSSSVMWAASEANPELWTKTILNAGGFGMAALVLYRIHLTAIESHAKTLEKLTETFREEIKAERTDCEEKIAVVRADNQKEHEALRATFRESFADAMARWLELFKEKAK